MKRTMHLYETHLPVKDTEVSSGFYVDVVGLDYAHRDLTRDVVFLWIGSKKRSMLGLWGPTTPWGQSHRCHFAVALALSDLLAPAHALPASASLREIFRARLQRNHRSSAGCHRRRSTFPTPTDIPLNTSRSLMKRPSASLSVRFQPGRRDKRWFNRAERTTRSPFEFCRGSRVGCNPAYELAVLRERQPATTGTWIVR